MGGGGSGRAAAAVSHCVEPLCSRLNIAFVHVFDPISTTVQLVVLQPAEQLLGRGLQRPQLALAPSSAPSLHCHYRYTAAAAVAVAVVAAAVVHTVIHSSSVCCTDIRVAVQRTVARDPSCCSAAVA